MRSEFLKNFNIPQDGDIAMDEIDVNHGSDEVVNMHADSDEQGSTDNNSANENNTNAQQRQILPFIPFKIRGRRPSETFATNLQPISE